MVAAVSSACGSVRRNRDPPVKATMSTRIAGRPLLRTGSSCPCRVRGGRGVSAPVASVRWSVLVVLLGLCLGELLEPCPARVDRRVVRVVRVVRESRTALGAQSRAIVHAQRLER